MKTIAALLLFGGISVACAEPDTAQIIERGPHHRVWTNANGGTYTEMANGLHYLDEKGQWIESKEEIEIINGVGVARQGQHSVIFSASASDIPATDMLLSDGQRLQSRVAGISYLDGRSGQSAWIALIGDSIGQVHPPNVVVYPGAFGKELLADIRCTYTKYGFEQDILLREQLTDPASLNPPLDPNTTLVQVWTEFFTAPAPEKQEMLVYQENDALKRQQMAVPDLVDEHLDFGGMQMGYGVAFSVSENGDPMGPSDSVRVCKTWVDEPNTGQHFLVETVPYSWLQPLLKRLPARQAAVKQPNGGALWGQVQPNREALMARLPKRPGKKKSAEKLQMASLPLRNFGRGVAIDFITINANKTNWNFSGSDTFYISGPVILKGAGSGPTNCTTFEAGCVLKFAPTNGAKLTIQNQINWQGTSYRPVVLTARDDTTVGETVSSFTITNYDTALDIEAATAGTNAILQNVRIAYATNAIVLNGKSGHTISHAQFVNCQNGITTTNAIFSLRNALFHNVQNAFNGTAATGHCEHITVDTANWLNYNSAMRLNVTNSLLVLVTNTGTIYSNFTISVSSASGVFTNVGAGYHYLADNTYRNLGSTNITASLAADLATMTTYPPIVLTNDFIVDKTLASQPIQDASPWALGYHYWPLHYAWTQLNLTNATLLLTNGVAIGIYGTNGTRLLYGARFISEGTPTNLNRLVRYTAVQEQSIDWGPSGTTKSLFDLTNSPSVGPRVNLRFTDIATVAGEWKVLDYRQYYFLDSFVMRDSQIRGGNLSISTFYMTTDLRQMTYGLTNNLLERASLGLSRDNLAPATRLSAYVHNNLLRFGSGTFKALTNDAAFEVKDNLFDTVTLSGNGGQGNYLTNSNNGYYQTTKLSGGTNDLTLAAVDYQTGPLGRFYYPTNGTNLNSLRDKGSVTNAGLAGLFHFTTTTNEVKETNSVLDIGWHVVGLAANNGPVDTDGEGLPDYFEDRNGNGVFDAAAGESDWQNANSSTNGLSDLQNWELSNNVLVNDPLQDMGNEQNTQSETAVIAFGNTVISAFVDSNLGVAGYGVAGIPCLDTNGNPVVCSSPTNLVRFTGWARSIDAGVTFTDMGAPPTNSSVIDVGYIFGGSAGDPVLTRDALNNIVYLLANPKRPSTYTNNGTTNHYAPLWRSLDSGQTFQPPINAVQGLLATSSDDFVDKPAIVVDNFGGTGQGNVYLEYWLNSKILFYRSVPGGTNWTNTAQFGSSAFGGQVAVAPNHDVYVVWRETGGSTNPVQFAISKSTDWGTTFTNLSNILTNNNAGSTPNDLKLTRSNNTSSDDFFRTPILPLLAVNPVVTNNLYVVYNDKPTGTSGDKADIFFVQSTNGGTNWSSPLRVNLDTTTNDQWQPALTVKPDGTKLFIAWYDRRNDATSNSLIQGYGVFANLPVTGTSSFATNFPISTVLFPPAFTGTNKVDGTYDPAYLPDLSDDPAKCCLSFGGNYSHHMGDYDQAWSDNNYVYYTWGDNRNTASFHARTRNEADVRFIRVSWPR